MADPTPPQRPFSKVIIVGAGPSGLLLALLLSKHGIPVHILEAAAGLDQQPRAAHYGAPAIPEFVRAGIADKIRERGMVLDTMCWRYPDTHEYMAGFDSGKVLRDVDGVDLRTHCLALQDLDQLMLEEVTEKFGGVVEWENKVVGVGQDGEGAWCEVEVGGEGGERKVVRGDYVVGCDGANSMVRKALFGDEFPGFTWDAQIIATNTYYDFKEKFGWEDANFIVHPEHFFMAARITRDGLYRITYGETPGLSREEYLERQPWKFETILPGQPKPDEYKIVNFSPYKMHQRCAPKFRVGRVMLAADAAHLCNPWGGLGITGGFVDVGGLYDCLAGIWEGKADESILDLYSEKRIEKWQTIINPFSQENFRRVSDKEPATRLERDEFMKMLQRGKEDEVYLKELLVGPMEVRYDFTQHYKKDA
ncbi:para-nitrophenol 4-monooxygenase [Staphylotrichum tortipilum]|uniref:Para-nitrophenol 4-monooxygenase n=1 Tax=Staphylotrichum tortipilum TaxID=2831512 RepID=A0AAN6MIY3_9PEZI|nr:para-nitrophenol 4-monooxygenase [Staphylotrichum longicolle]